MVRNTLNYQEIPMQFPFPHLTLKSQIYQTIPDTRAAEHQLVRAIDESGEDYLYPADYFVPIELSEALIEVLSATD